MKRKRTHRRKVLPNDCTTCRGSGWDATFERICNCIAPGAHISSEHCWCHPRRDYFDPASGSEVWIHHYAH